MHSVGDRVAVWLPTRGKHYTGVLTRIYRCRHKSKIWIAKVFDIEWDDPETPDPLPMPLHGLVTADAMRRTETYAGAGETQKVAMNICGQVIGQINEVESCRGVVYRLINEYLEALEQVNALMPGD